MGWRDIEGQQQRGEILRMELRGVRLIVLDAGVWRMVAAAVDEYAIVLGEGVFLPRPRPQVPETAVDKDHRRAAVTAEPVRQARAVDVGDVGRRRRRDGGRQGRCDCRGRGALGGWSAAT